MTASPRTTQAFDADAILDAALWVRAEQLYGRWCALDELRRVQPTWRSLRMSTRLAWWERAFDELCVWGGR